MWSNGGTSGGDPGGGPGPWNQWASFNPFTMDPAMAAAGEVDWAALAQQWIQMKDTQPPPGLHFQALQAHQQLQLGGPSAIHLAHAGNSLLMHQAQLPQGLVPAAAQIPREMAPFNGMLNPPVGFQMEPMIPHTREENRSSRVEPAHHRLEVKDEWTKSSNSFQARDYGHSQSSKFRDSAPSSSTALWDAVQRHASMNDRRGGASSDGNDDGSGGDHSRSSFDTAEMMKKKSLPAWIREGLEKVEREKRKKQEKEEEDARRARELEEERLHAAQQEKSPTNTKWARESDEDSDGEKSDVEKRSGDSNSELRYRIERFLRHLNHDDNIDEMMLCIRRQLTSVLLQGTSELMTKIVKDTLEECKQRARRKSKIDLDLVSEREIKRAAPVPKPRIQLVNHGSSSDSDSESGENEPSKPEVSSPHQANSQTAEEGGKNAEELTRSKPDQIVKDRGDERKSFSRSPSPKRTKVKKSSSSPKRHRDRRHRSRSNSRSRSTSRSRTRKTKRSRSRSRSRTSSKQKKSKASRHRDRDERSVSRSKRSRSDSRSRRRNSKERKKSKKKRSRSRSRSRDRSPGRSNRRTEGKKKKKRRSPSSSPERRRR